MNSVKFKSGHTARLDSINVTRTYGGCLEGRPSVEDAIKVMLNQIGRHWGDRKTELLPPRVTEDRLPEYCVAGWFTSFDPVTEGHGSELVVVWFADSFTLPGDLEELASNLDWKALADDFYI